MGDFIYVSALCDYDPEEEEYESEEDRAAFDPKEMLKAANATLKKARLREHREPEGEAAEQASWASPCNLLDLEKLVGWATELDASELVSEPLEQLMMLEAINGQLIVPVDFADPLTLDESLHQRYSALLSTQQIKRELETLARFLCVNLDELPIMADPDYTALWSEEEEEERQNRFERSGMDDHMVDVLVSRWVDSGRVRDILSVLALTQINIIRYFIICRAEEDGVDLEKYDALTPTQRLELQKLAREELESAEEERRKDPTILERDLAMSACTEDDYRFLRPSHALDWVKIQEMQFEDIVWPISDGDLKRMFDFLGVDGAMALRIGGGKPGAKEMALFCEALREAGVGDFLQMSVWLLAQMHEACRQSLEHKASILF
ncbi:MAG: hypothetical protein BWZ10_00293 [candidate division BRC1 bacterium ADurb.BinA364]|nr:MAG: hypothetical protein BWZ10_00293 [candidate division BRC1 bacterium ADurb.BinA364]